MFVRDYVYVFMNRMDSLYGRHDTSVFGYKFEFITLSYIYYYTTNTY